MTMLDRIVKLRAEALGDAMKSPAFATVRALDDAVVAAGGKRLIDGIGAENVIAAAAAVKPRPLKAYGGRAPKVPQGDAAEAALKANGPLPVGVLLEKAVEKGAKVGGDKPLVSFRSMLSKDDRFYSLQRNNMYFWWLSDTDLPEGFLPEPEDSDLWGSGSTTNEEGGDAHAATMS